MINTLKKIIQIDTTISINSFIYNVKKTPLIKHLFKNVGYKSNDIKEIIKIIAYAHTILRKILFRSFYFFFIYMLASSTERDIEQTFITFYITLSVFGSIINSIILAPNEENYYMIELFNVNATYYMKVALIKNLLNKVLFDLIILSVIKYILGIDGINIIMMVLLVIPLKIIGEAFDVLWYKKHNYMIKKRYIPIFTSLVIMILVSSLVFFDVYITDLTLFIVLIITSIIGIYAYKYINKQTNYKITFKKINTLANVMNEDVNRSDVEMKIKDINISHERLKNKHGYDLFNAIFIERHKGLMFRSSMYFALIIAGIYLIAIILCIFDSDAKEFISVNLSQLFTYFPLVFYYINRGQLITKAMFYNSDHAMLTYNFYRKKNVIIGMFKRRLKSMVLINMIPASVIGIGNIILFIMTNEVSLITLFASLLYIISLTIFFSLHYLVLYYLLEPFSKTSSASKNTYIVITILTYFVCINVSKYLNVSILLLSICGIIFTVLYAFLAMVLITKFAPKTFKLN